MCRASLNTLPAWSRLRAPEAICEFCLASGPAMCASAIAAISPVLPFLRPIDRYASRVPYGLS